jgi:hypothetical protein
MVGSGAGIGLLNTSVNSTAVGYEAMKTTTATRNTAVGYQAMLANTLGLSNTTIGAESLDANIDGDYNVAIGVGALGSSQAGDLNSGLGYLSLFSNISGSRNTGVGSRSLVSVTGSGNVGVGSYAGYYETGSDAFYVNNQDRSTTAADKTSSLMYGVFNATASSQLLTINASTTIAQNLTVLGSGTNYFLGNVGIGTTTPISTLSIVGATASTTVYLGSTARPTCVTWYSVPSGLPFREYINDSGTKIIESGQCSGN